MVAVLVDAVSRRTVWRPSVQRPDVVAPYPFYVQRHHEALSAQAALDAGCGPRVAAFIVGVRRGRMRSWRLHCGPLTRHPERMAAQTDDAADSPSRPSPPVAVPVGPPPEFQVELAVFEGPLPLLLHLIESAELDILTVPLATVADAYVAYLATHPVDAANLAQFVATAAQLILIKSRRLLPPEPTDALPDGTEDIDEEELRRRLLAYRAIRDAARELAAATS